MQKPAPVDTEMTKNPVSIESTATVSDALNLMKQKGLEKIVVTVEGRPCAIIEEWRAYTVDTSKKISEVLDRFQPVTTISSGTTMDDAKRLLANKPALIVVGKNQTDMLGILTITDFVRFLKKSF